MSSFVKAPPAKASPARQPSHVAIIMDGNGRWSELRGRDRVYGHLKGARVAKNIIETCAHLQIPQLTLYAFSTENWLRPKLEVSFLMMLLSRHLRRERKSLMDNNIRFSVIGEIERLPANVLSEVNKTIEVTRNNTGMSLTFALSYGGRREIADAVRSIASDASKGLIQPEDITEEMISDRLQSSFLIEPDLIIRTSGEYRLSNFMLWQAAYSELYVTPTLWPDFDKADLLTAFNEYSRRERRFGCTSAQLSLHSASSSTAMSSDRNLESPLAPAIP